MALVLVTTFASIQAWWGYDNDILRFSAISNVNFSRYRHLKNLLDHWHFPLYGHSKLRARLCPFVAPSTSQIRNFHGKNRVCELFPRISQKCHFAKSNNASWYDDITQISCTYIEIYCILSHENHPSVCKGGSGQNIVGHQTPLLVDLVPALLSMALQ